MDTVGREGGGKEGENTELMEGERERERDCVSVWTGEGLRFIAEPKAHTILRSG